MDCNGFGHVEEAIRYCEGVVAGKIVACKWTRLACQRQIDDLARADEDEDWPFYFDAEEADRVCRFMDHLRGKWLIEIAELDAMSRAEDTAFKAFITRRVDKFRPAYGRREVEWPRQCIFVGTTNKSVYLKDETGGRRYWPVRCTSIDLASLERDRDQIWAEAVYLYRRGRPWHITDPGLLRRAEAEQQSRYDSDVWEETVTEYVSDKHEVTISEIMKTALSIEIPRMDRGDRLASGRTAWIMQEPND